MKKARFTLVELLASMAVFLILMAVMFQFIGSAQRAWTASNATTEVYQNARILFDVLARDLQGSVARADDVQGQHLKFERVGEGELAFVSAIEEGNGRLAEVAYSFVNNEVQRAFTIDTPGVTWNPYGDRSNYSTLAGATGASTGTVVDGVLAATFTCFDADYSPTAWSGDIETSLPTAVNLKVTLMDAKSMVRYNLLSGAAKTQWETERARSFSKTIFLGGR